SVNNRYLASNWLTGHIVAIDSEGNQSYFVTNEYCKNGLHIEGNTVFAACIDQGIKGFDLSDTSLVMHVMIDGMINLNDITSDTSGNIYVTDVYGSKIYKIRLSDQNYSVFADNGIVYPNGIYFDERHNRLLLVSFRHNSPIQAINLQDSSVTTIVNTGRNNLDGITEDNEGNIYFSSWGTSSIYMFDSTFTYPPELYYTNSGGPADIYYNKQDYVLAVPVMNYNYVEFIYTQTSTDENEITLLPNEIRLYTNYPNPFNAATTIKYDLPAAATVSIKVYDILGRSIDTIRERNRPAGLYQITWHSEDAPSGVYFYSIITDYGTATKRMTLIK
ncbi:MAG: T9SS type A sorting domain-containing protein, partial [candidate division Zixibacteria bacterium]